MPINWQRIPVPFFKGLDTKADAKGLAPGSLTVLENGVFSTPGEINKRFGLSSRSLDIEPSGSLSRGVALSPFGAETILFDGNSAYTWLDSSNKWIRRGTARSLETTTVPIAAATTAYRNPDVAVTGSYALYVYENPEPNRWGNGTSLRYYGVRCTLVDWETGAVVINNQVCALTGTNPRAVLFSGSLYALYATWNSTLIGRRIDPSSPSTLGSEVKLASNVRIQLGNVDGRTRGARMDALATSDRLFVAYDTSVASGDGVVLCGFTSSLSTLGLSASVTMSSNYGGCPLALWSDASENVWLASPSGSFNGGTFLANNTPIRAQVWSNRLATVMTATNVTPLSGTGGVEVTNLAGVCTSGSVSNVFYELSSSADRNYQLMVASFGPGLASTSASFKRGLGLVSRPFVREGSQFVWTLYGSSEQPTYFLLDGDGNVASKANAIRAGYFRTSNNVSSVVQTKSGSFLFAGERRGRVLSDSGSLFTFPGVAGTTVDFVSTTGSFWSARLGRQLHTVGGVLSSYDGLTFGEHGFHIYPEGLTATVSSSGGSINSGSYQFCATYDWTDAYGQIHRSRPSTPITVHLTGAAATPTGSITVTVPALRLTAKEGSSPVAVSIWRTEDFSSGSGDIFYRITPVTQSLTSSIDVDTVSFRDTLRDDNIISREVLYTTSGELENDPPPTCTMIETWQNRIWLGGLEDPNALRYSKRSVYDEAVGFPDVFELRIDAQGGDIAAIKALDDSLVVFKERGIHRVYPLTSDGTPYGGGPDNTGAGGEWAQEPIASDVGCVNPNSVERTDMGIFFASTKGIYLLGRDRSLRYVGAPVEAYNGLTITSANLVATQNQVRFTTSDGVCLVYDYLMDQWSTFTNYESADAAVVAGQYMLLRSDGTVEEEVRDSYSDDGAHIPLKLTTGWVSFAGLQGFQRVRRIGVLGDWESNHRLSASVAFDYGSPSQEVVLDPSSTPPYQYELHLHRQKCTALQLTLQDVASGSVGRSLALSNTAFEVGVMSGGPRSPKGRHGAF